MANARDDRPIVIMGTGIPAVCAIINMTVDIAYNAPDNGPATNVFVLDTMDEPKPDEGTLYPLNGIALDAMHPFTPVNRPPGFPSFGEYAREIATEDVDWNAALHSPTYRHVNVYLEYMLELALTAVGDKAYLDAGNKPVKSIEATLKEDTARIHFADGTTLDAKRIVPARKPPHMGGPNLARSPRYMAGPSLSDQGASAAQRKDVPAESRMRLTLDLIRGAADIALGKTGLLHDMDKKSHFLVVLGTRRIAAIALDLPEVALGPRVHLVLQDLDRVGATEMWVVTPERVAEAVQSQLQGKPVRFLSLSQFLSLIEKLSAVGPALDE